MGGSEKITIAESFGILTEEQKQEIYNKYGEDVVKTELERARSIKCVIEDDDIVDVQRFIKIFGDQDGIKISNNIMEDIKVMLKTKD